MMIHEDRVRMEKLFDRLWPIPRSIMGPGFRDSLSILSESIPFERLQFATGARVFDWIVPNEWVPHDAYIVDPLGQKHCEFSRNNLHLMGYSVPFRGTLALERLLPHLYSLPEQPKAIPFVTSFYEENWGLALSHDELCGLPDGDYQVVIDTELKPGHLECGERVLEGAESSEVLFSTYLCHPSLASNELSGPLVMAFLYERLAAMPNRRLTYRFVVNAETIGTICYLSRRGEHLKKQMVAGYELTCLGDRNRFNYKKSRAGNSLADRVMMAVLRGYKPERNFFAVREFDPSVGSEERQYCSPGFDLPMGLLGRSLYGEYPEYHTSLDNKSFVSFDAMIEAVDVLWDCVCVLESNHCWKSTAPYGEPHLSRRGLYPTVSIKRRDRERVKALMWVLSMADGSQDLIDMADKSGLSVKRLMSVIEELVKAGLLV